jgi:hypothetical protein
MLRGKGNWIVVAAVVSLVVFSGSEAFGVNLIESGDFEGGITGWSDDGSGAAVTHNTDMGYVFTGTGSLRLYEEDGPITGYAASNVFALDPSKVYALTFDVLGVSGSQVYTTLEANDGYYAVDVVDPQDAWTSYSSYFMTGPTASTGFLKLYTFGRSGAALFFDNVSLVPLVPEGEVPFLEGDANGDGVVSAGDYAAVQANFGNTLPEGGATTPEPATICMVTMGMVAVVRRRRK